VITCFRAAVSTFSRAAVSARSRAAVGTRKPSPVPIWLWIIACNVSGLAISVGLLRLLDAARPLP
jgi:hypothetical protein